MKYKFSILALFLVGMNSVFGGGTQFSPYSIELTSYYWNFFAYPNIEPEPEKMMEFRLDFSEKGKVIITKNYLATGNNDTMYWKYSIVDETIYIYVTDIRIPYFIIRNKEGVWNVGSPATSMLIEQVRYEKKKILGNN